MQKSGLQVPNSKHGENAETDTHVSCPVASVTLTVSRSVRVRSRARCPRACTIDDAELRRVSKCSYDQRAYGDQHMYLFIARIYCTHTHIGICNESITLVRAYHATRVQTPPSPRGRGSAVRPVCPLYAGTLQPGASPLPCPRTGHTYRRVSPSTLLRPDNPCPLEACQTHVEHMSLPAALHNIFRSAAQSAGAGPLLHRKRLLLRYLTPRRNWAYPCLPTALWLMRLLPLSAWTSWQASFPWPARLCPPASPASPLPSRRGTRPACSRFARRPNQTLPCAPK